MSYVTGNTIKELREKRQFTQKQLAEKLNVSDKTISKWETNKGLPDVGIITELSKALGVSLAELLTGEYAENKNRSSNMKKYLFMFVLFVEILFKQWEVVLIAAAVFYCLS